MLLWEGVTGSCDVFYVLTPVNHSQHYNIKTNRLCYLRGWSIWSLALNSLLGYVWLEAGWLDLRKTVPSCSPLLSGSCYPSEFGHFFTRRCTTQECRNLLRTLWISFTVFTDQNCKVLPQSSSALIAFFLLQQPPVCRSIHYSVEDWQHGQERVHTHILRGGSTLFSTVRMGL